MKKVISIVQVIVIMMFVLLSGIETALAAEPSLVASMDYNGHHYEIYYQSGISWTSAKAYAEDMEYNGEQGYLATVTTMGEHYAVASLNPSYADSFLGAKGTTPNRLSTWKWATGPEAGQSVMSSRPPWMTGEPSASSGEVYLIIRANNLWDNRGLTNRYVNYFIVEYGGLGPIPETSYGITYNNVAGAANSNPSSYCASDTPLTLQDLGTRAGYTFGGWYDNAELSGSVVTSIPEGATGAQTFWAKWTQNDYSVTYSGNGSDGGTVPNDETVYHYEDEVMVSSDVPTKTGYIFGGWSDGESIYDGGETFGMPAHSVTLTAQWTPIDYTVTYSGNGNDGGIVPGDDTIYHYEDEVTVLSDEPTKTGYTFAGWSDGTNIYEADDTFDMPAGNVMLTAQWTAIDYAVTYDGNGSDGGIVPGDDTVYHYEDEVTVLSDEPTKTGYTFGGWSDGANMYNSGDTFTMPADDVTLTAQWTAIDYTVTYSGNGSDGGVVPSDNTVYHYQDEVTVLSDEPTRTGYTFAGWSDGTNIYEAEGTFDMPADDVTLTAQWTAIDYTVTYSGNGNRGGVVPDAATYHYEDVVTISSGKPTRSGYTFAGWSDGTDTYNGGDTFVMPAGDVTLTAQWTKKRVTSVTVSSSSEVLTVGETVLLYADVLPDDVINAAVVWTSSDETVATVDADGQVAAVGAGRAEITAAAGGKFDVCAITVNEAAAASTPTPAAAVEDEASAPPTPTVQAITITPYAIEEENGTYIIEISVDNLPEGTSAIQTPDGQVVSVDDAETIRIMVPEENISENGTVEIVVLNNENSPLGVYGVQLDNGQERTGNALLWIVIGIVLTGIMKGIFFIIIINRRKKGPAD